MKISPKILEKIKERMVDIETELVMQKLELDVLKEAEFKGELANLIGQKIQGLELNLEVTIKTYEGLKKKLATIGDNK